MKIYDDSNYQELLAHHDEILTADGSRVGVHVSGGQKRYLSYKQTPVGRGMMAAAPRFGDNFPAYSRTDLSAIIKDRKDRKRRISDFQYFAPHDQNGLPTCWANGPSHQLTTQRVIQGLVKPGEQPVYISACSAAVPISGGHVGGDEWEAGQYFKDHGAASVDVWPNNDTSNHNSDPAVMESRKHHVLYTMYSLSGFMEFATAMLLDPPMPVAVAYNWWSHVISGGDVVEIEAGSFGFMMRNNWGDWGDKNDLGQSGYITLREGHGTPDSGFAIGVVTQSAA